MTVVTSIRLLPIPARRIAIMNCSLEKWRFRLFSGFRSQVKPAAVEVDGVNEVLFVPKSTRRVLHPLDLGVDRFAGRVGDVMPQVGDDVLEPALEHPCYLDHRLQTAPYG